MGTQGDTAAGMISGCYPLDEFYKQRPEAIRLKEIKKGR